MSAYLIADIEVTDAAGFEEYRSKVAVTIAAHGGRYLVRGGAMTLLEGEWLPKRCVVLEFPSAAQMKAWYASPEYAPLIALRQRTTKSKLVMVEGL
jgi:uncharacterized protein (DUF1330 family)